MTRKRCKGITIVGLGPGGSRYLTAEAKKVLQRSKEIYVRTSRHPVVGELPRHLQVRSFDQVYEERDSFEEVYRTIARQVLELGQGPEGVVYAVPGHPLVAEESVRLILAEAKARNIPVRLVAGLSFLEPVFAALGVDPFQRGLQLLDATALAGVVQGDEARAMGDLYCRGDHTDCSALLRRILSPQTPLLLCQLYSRKVASHVKLGLLELYPSEHQVALVQAAGVEGREQTTTLPLYELDRHEVDHLTCVYVPPLEPEQDLSSFETLRAIVSRLRGPTGCPWDREQTRESLKPYLVEESYEVLDAIDSGDPGKLAEELGDLLLQVVLHAQLASERDEFAMDEVIKGISAKLIRRHPHVFGHWTVSGSAEVVRNWEQIKRAEKGERRSAISGVPKHLPALAFAQVVQRRAARAGFDWPEPAGVLEKVREEIGELSASRNGEERKAELGDLLFALVNLARWLNVDAEEALRQANQRFLKRFHRMEERAAEKGQDFSKLGPEEQDRLWEEAKTE